LASVVARGVRFNVQRLGSGERLLVLLHGLVFDNLSSWYFTAAARLANRHSVLLYDLRGHGLSEQPPTGYTLDDMALDLAAILDEVGESRRVTLVGNSFGGLVALWFARRFPDRVDSLVLVESPLADTGYGRRMSETLALEGDARDRKIAEMFGDWLARHELDGRLGQDATKFKGIADRSLARRRKPMMRVAERLVQGTSLAADIAHTPGLTSAEVAEIGCPVLAVYGEDSDTRDQGEAIAAALPHCRLEIVPGAEHFVLLHGTEELCDRIEAWLDELERPSPPER